jgi:hypothetical protein
VTTELLDLHNEVDNGIQLSVYEGGDTNICLFIHENEEGLKFWLNDKSLEELVDVLTIELERRKQ